MAGRGYCAANQKTAPQSKRRLWNSQTPVARCIKSVARCDIAHR